MLIKTVQDLHTKISDLIVEKKNQIDDTRRSLDIPANVKAEFVQTDEDIVTGLRMALDHIDTLMIHEEIERLKSPKK